MKFSLGGLILIIFGLLALARNLGFLRISLAELVGTWWPVGLIALGAGLFFSRNDSDKSR